MPTPLKALHCSKPVVTISDDLGAITVLDGTKRVVGMLSNTIDGYYRYLAFEKLHDSYQYTTGDLILIAKYIEKLNKKLAQ